MPHRKVASRLRPEPLVIRYMTQYHFNMLKRFFLTARTLILRPIENLGRKGFLRFYGVDLNAVKPAPPSDSIRDQFIEIKTKNGWRVIPKSRL
jgi:hypothetical protein